MAELRIGDLAVVPAIEVEVSKPRYGATLDTFFGKVDENGVLTKDTTPVDLVFDGVKEIGNNALSGKFKDNDDINKVSFPDLVTVSHRGLSDCFHDCNSLKTIILKKLTKIDTLGMTNCFFYDNSIKSASFESLTIIGENGMTSCFGGCRNLETFLLPKLETLGVSAMSGCFAGYYNPNNKIKEIRFPALKSVQSNSFGASSYEYAFTNADPALVLHFPASMQTAIEAMTGYADKWGTPTTTILFDL